MTALQISGIMLLFPRFRYSGLLPVSQFRMLCAAALEHQSLKNGDNKPMPEDVKHSTLILLWTTKKNTTLWNMSRALAWKGKALKDGMATALTRTLTRIRMEKKLPPSAGPFSRRHGTYVDRMGYLAGFIPLI